MAGGEDWHPRWWTRFTDTKWGRRVLLGYALLGIAITLLTAIGFIRPDKTAELLRGIATKIETQSAPAVRVNFNELFQDRDNPSPTMFRYYNNSSHAAAGEVSVFLYHMENGKPSRIFARERDYMDISLSRDIDDIGAPRLSGDVLMCVHYLDGGTIEVTRLRPRPGGGIISYETSGKPLASREKTCDAAAEAFRP